MSLINYLIKVMLLFKPVLVLNKPIYVGFTVCWFDAELLFTDTNSLVYEKKSENVYEEFFQWKDLFDFSNYSKDSKFFEKFKIY